MAPEDHRNEDPRNVLEEIASILGDDIVKALRLEFPGVRVYFGKSPDPNGALVKAIAMPAAVTLGEYFGGDHITIPSGKAEAMARAGREKRQLIRQLRADGLTIQDIALRVGVTERWVYYALAEARPDPRQGDMFSGWPSRKPGNDNSPT